MYACDRSRIVTEGLIPNEYNENDYLCDITCTSEQTTNNFDYGDIEGSV